MFDVLLEIVDELLPVPVNLEDLREGVHLRSYLVEVAEQLLEIVFIGKQAQNHLAWRNGVLGSAFPHLKVRNRDLPEEGLRLGVVGPVDYEALLAID